MFVQNTIRKNSTSWSQSDAISAAESAPSGASGGTAMSDGAGVIQFFVSDLSSVTDYSLQIWAYINSKWTCVDELLNLGDIARGPYEYALTAYRASRYDVILSEITGTSLKINYRQV